MSKIFMGVKCKGRIKSQTLKGLHGHCEVQLQEIHHLQQWRTWNKLLQAERELNLGCRLDRWVLYKLTQLQKCNAQQSQKWAQSASYFPLADPSLCAQSYASVWSTAREVQVHTAKRYSITESGTPPHAPLRTNKIDRYRALNLLLPGCCTIKSLVKAFSRDTDGWLRTKSLKAATPNGQEVNDQVSTLSALSSLAPLGGKTITISG